MFIKQVGLFSKYKERDGDCHEHDTAWQQGRDKIFNTFGPGSVTNRLHGLGNIPKKLAIKFYTVN